MNALDKNSPAYLYAQKLRDAVWAELDALGQAKGVASGNEDADAHEYAALVGLSDTERNQLYWKQLRNVCLDLVGDTTLEMDDIRAIGKEIASHLYSENRCWSNMFDSWLVYGHILECIAAKPVDTQGEPQ